MFNTNKCWRRGCLHILCTAVFKLKSFGFFFQQLGQISSADIINIILSTKTLKQRSGIHWALTALLKKNKTLVSTCPFGKRCDCFGWCTKQKHYYFMSFTVQELIKRHQQIPNLGFLKRCIFKKANLPICIISSEVWDSSHVSFALMIKMNYHKQKCHTSSLVHRGKIGYLQSIWGENI